MSRLLDKKNQDGSYPFEYRSSAHTDITVTWKKARLRLELEKAKRQVLQLPKRGQK